MDSDIFSLGLRHQLRIRRPLALVEDVANIFNANVEVVFFHNKRYDDDRGVITVFDYKKEGANENLVLRLPFLPYLYHKLSPDSLNHDIDWDSHELLVDVDSCLRDGEYYRLEGFRHEDCNYLLIFKELVYWGIDFPYLWDHLVEIFHASPILNDSSRFVLYRMKVARLYQLLGCNLVFYFSDNCCGRNIYSKACLKADDFLSFMSACGFCHEASLENENRASHGVLIDLPAFYLGTSPTIDSVDCVGALFDDFRDLEI